MTFYILTPIDNTDNLPDGWYAIPFPDGRTAMGVNHFYNGQWQQPFDPQSSFLRPLTNATLLTRDIAESIWNACHDFYWHPGPEVPNKQTFIDELFKESK